MARARRVRLKAVSGSEGGDAGRPLAFRFPRAKWETFHEGAESAAGDANLCLEDWPRSVRMAIYHSGQETPATVDITGSNPRELIDWVVEQVDAVLDSEGGTVPRHAVRAIVENLIHAEFRGAAVSVLDGGRRVIVSDSGRGVVDIERALEPGYSTATAAMRTVISGVGSGLPMVREAMERCGGSLRLGANLGGGLVVTLATAETMPGGTMAPVRELGVADSSIEAIAGTLPSRRMQVLLLMADGRELGPSEVANHVRSSLTTAYRDLTKLEQDGLITYTARGKRVISEHGQAVVAHVLSGLQ